MDFEAILKMVVNYGLGVVLSLGMAIYLGRLLNRVLTQNEIREQKLAEIISKDIMNVQKSLADQDVEARKIRDDLIAALRRQREEHEEQRKAYAKIIEENEARRQAQILIIDSLNLIKNSLVEISKKECKAA